MDRERPIKFHYDGNKITFDETCTIMDGDELLLEYAVDDNNEMYDVDIELKRRKMDPQLDKRFIYKIKGYDYAQQHKFKVLVAAYTFDEAMEVGKQIAGPNGSVESVKETCEVIFSKGEV